MFYRMMTVLLDINQLILLLMFILHFPIMLALCLMLSMTHYAQNFAGIIGRSLSQTIRKDPLDFPVCLGSYCELYISSCYVTYT